jgi:predicted aspartyl protease
MADMRRVERDMATVIVRIGDRERYTPCIFGDDGSVPLLGVVTLEEFGLGVDPVNQRLIETPGLLMRGSSLTPAPPSAH